ncbi:uncharacterized protein LOC110033443 isoform X2 [Phalaenopsis equestris]|uniref:uncharacterized protein LOC110033443 isoform X2 n=1 Tax=Phalaenopsis equestris TaxID=78828 RepID=UPI0009E5D933|nr:uncharacterized protein LOC110033443 isoform X2 [Phalaenopsis equestris]
MVSQRWAYIRIVTGTILGGVLGFYVMHRVEMGYKERRTEEIRRYQNEMKRRQQEEEAQSELWSDS